MRTRTSRWLRFMGLAALLVAGPAGRAAAPAATVIDVSARRFQFSPPELRLRIGVPVTLRVTSADVTHGLYQKELGIDAELRPGQATEVSFTPARAGRYTAICDHFCGAGHGNMRLLIVVE